MYLAAFRKLSFMRLSHAFLAQKLELDADFIRICNILYFDLALCIDYMSRVLRDPLHVSMFFVLCGTVL